VSNLSRTSLTVMLAGVVLRVSMAAGSAPVACADAPMSVVIVCLVNHDAPDTQTEQLVMDEAARLWMSAGVTVHWSTEERTTVAPDVYVRLTSAPAPIGYRAIGPALASIVFTEGQPGSLITVFAMESRRLLEATRVNDRPLGDRPLVLRRQLLGRLLGRAVAHELGHFLFKSREHAGRGLMRANLSVIELISPTRERFRIVPPDVASCVKPH